MSEETVNIHDAKTRLSQLVARAEKGERITIARGGKPVAELGPTRKRKRQALGRGNAEVSQGRGAREQSASGGSALGLLYG